MVERRFLLAIAHTFIGVGLAYIHIHHVSNIFEMQHNFSHLYRAERDVIFSQEQAIYYHYYKTIVEEDNFKAAFHKLTHDNLTEYPLVINAVSKYHIYPEIAIGYLYRQFMYVTKTFNIPTTVCWTLKRDKQENVYSCEGIGEAIYFYLSIIWGLSGVTVFLLYTYGTFLSRNMIGGLSAVIYYFIIHNDATSVHVTPFCRENIAFPFILAQIFYLTVSIGRYRTVNLNPQHRINITMVGNLMVVTIISLLSWQFSSIIFITQIFAVFLLVECNVISKNLVVDYCISQSLSIVITNAIMLRNGFSSVHLTLVLSLFFVITSKIEAPTRIEQIFHGPQMSKLKRFLCNILIMFMVAYCLTDFEETLMGILNYFLPSRVSNGSSSSSEFSNNNNNFVNETFQDEFSRYYMSLILTKLGLLNPTFNSILYFSNPLHDFISFETIKLFNYVFVIKNISIVIILFLGRFLQRRRDKYNNSIQSELIERAKNYVIEDYLEENRITMQNLTDPKTEADIKKCIDALAKLNYDYDKYKIQKRKRSPNVIDEKKTFLSDIKKLKSQINEKERKDKGETVENAIEDKSIDNGNNDNPKSAETDEKAEQNQEDNRGTAGGEGATDPTVKTDIPKPLNSSNFLSDVDGIQSPYIYNIVQTMFLFALTVLICNLKFVFAPFLCIIGSSLPCRSWFSKNSSIYWLLYIFLLVCNVVNPGLKNIYKQYEQPTNDYSNAEIYELLNWIHTTTEPNAIFGGTSDITPTILVSTRRPIVNHPLNEYSKARYRTPHIYSVYSKKTSAKIHNELVKIVVQYVVIPYDSCFMPFSNGLKITDMWDMVELENHNNTQYCVSVYDNSKDTNFLKVFNNFKYLVIKLFSRSVQLDVKKMKKYLKYDM